MYLDLTNPTTAQHLSPDTPPLSDPLSDSTSKSPVLAARPAANISFISSLRYEVLEVLVSAGPADALKRLGVEMVESHSANEQYITYCRSLNIFCRIFCVTSRLSPSQPNTLLRWSMNFFLRLDSWSLSLTNTPVFHSLRQNSI